MKDNFFVCIFSIKPQIILSAGIFRAKSLSKGSVEMKKLPILPFAAGLLAAAVLSGCSAMDGEPDTYNDSQGAATDRGTTFTTTTARVTSPSSTTTSRMETITSSYTSKTDDSRTLPERADSAAERVGEKADEITDDVADGINDGLDATQSIVDDVLR